MIFAKRYADLIFHSDKHEIKDKICGEVDYRVRQRLVAIMEEYDQPISVSRSRYDNEDTEETDAFIYACEKFNDIMDTPYIQTSYMGISISEQGHTNLAAYCLAFIFSVIELQYELLDDNYLNVGDIPYYSNPEDNKHPITNDEKADFSKQLNAFFDEYNIPWRILDGKMIKIDAQQFECDLKAKALAAMKELKDAEPKFKSAYSELMSAIECFEKNDFNGAVSRSGKSYESVLKVILGADRGNSDKLTKQYAEEKLIVPETMKADGFREKVMMSLPYIRNNSGADHGAGDKTAEITKPMAQLAINLAASLNTFLIEEYAASHDAKKEEEK